MKKRCSNCNGTLKLSSDKTKWICDFCESEFWIEKDSETSFIAQKSNDAVFYIGTVKVEKECISKVDNFMFNGEKLNAIKYVREVSGLGLAEAKNWVENYKNYNIEEPHSINLTSTSSQQASNKSGCYVATAVYGSYDCPEVWTLRRYRDNTLAEKWYGRLFIKLYYTISPTLVKWFGDTDWFKKLWKGKLDRMVANLQAEGVESTPYKDRNW